MLVTTPIVEAYGPYFRPFVSRLNRSSYFNFSRKVFVNIQSLLFGGLQIIAVDCMTGIRLNFALCKRVACLDNCNRDTIVIIAWTTVIKYWTIFSPQVNCSTIKPDTAMTLNGMLMIK